MTTKRAPTILACDPSFTAWGWAVVDIKDNIIDTGCIKTSPSSKKRRIRKGDDRCRRISEINQKLIGIINQYHISLIFSEQPHGSQSSVAAIMIGICLGIVQTISDVMKVPLEWYLEQEAKKNLLGKRSATKEETIQAIIKRYNWTPSGTKYIDEAVADALSIHHIGRTQSQLYRVLSAQ